MPTTVKVPPTPDHPQALLHGRRHAADRLERVVDATPGDRLDGRDRIVASCVDDVGRAAETCEVELGVVDVDRDDLLRVRQPGSLDGREPDATATDHGDGRSGRAPARC